jgi:peptidoglycan/LPS O-acetylase OafA/YrhL
MEIWDVVVAYRIGVASIAEVGSDVRRIGWLDGLRGFAAMQVVMLHYACVFLPALGFANPRFIHFAWERPLIGTPLTFLFDGTTAVHLFFIMSGVVLTCAFSGRPFAILAVAGRRLTRLGLPMAAALMLAATSFTVFPNAHLAAARILGPSWLGMPVSTVVSVGSIVHQTLIEGLLAGYRDQSFLPDWSASFVHLMPLTEARDPPLWTLHTEFVGSLLVASLVALRGSVGRATYSATCLVLACCFLRSPISLFIIGHLAAAGLRQTGSLRHTSGGAWRLVLAAASLVAGILLCTTRIVPVPQPLLALIPLPAVGPIEGIDDLPGVLGAGLIFASLHLLPTLRRFLETPALRWLGKISFSLYLTHYPVLFTMIAAAYALLARALPFGVSLAIGCLGGIGLSLAIAALFERWIDRPSIRLSHRVCLPRQPVSPPMSIVKTV